MIFSVGTDIIEIERVERACQKLNFTKTVYTDEEIRLFSDKSRSMAGNFAAKEAVAKAFGTGFGRIQPKDIEILRDDKGKPYVVLYNEAKTFAQGNNITAVKVSISHNKRDAVAFALTEVDKI